LINSKSIQAKLLHGEQYLAIKGDLPDSGTLVSTARLLEVLDKGKAAAVTTITETKDKETGKLIYENTSTVFIRGAGGFGGKKTGAGKLVARYAPYEPLISYQTAETLPLSIHLQSAHLMLSWRRKRRTIRLLYIGNMIPR
jgi:hypothetical protein